MILAITPGDPAGIGPEIVWKSIQALHPRPGGSRAAFLCVGAREPFEKLGARIVDADADQLSNGPPAAMLDGGPAVWLLSAPAQAPRLKNRKAAFLPGYQSGWAIETATRLVQKRIANALVTGPISKERLQKGGYLFPGHTEFLASLCGVKEVTMMLANDSLRISLVTTHLALKDVPRALTRARLRRAVLHTSESLRKWWGIEKPRLAVAALNPHAGEGGLFGKEETRVIEPELAALRRSARSKHELLGPLPADTLFAKHQMASAADKYDAVVCMYHDQGLIPVKLLDFPRTVNVTLGLPIIRTSVDHGVGFDIAGKNIADPSSLRAAIELATRFAMQAGR